MPNRSAFVNEILIYAFDVMVTKNIQTTEQVDLMIKQIENRIDDMKFDINTLVALKNKLEKDGKGSPVMNEKNESHP